MCDLYIMANHNTIIWVSMYLSLYSDWLLELLRVKVSVGQVFLALVVW